MNTFLKISLVRNEHEQKKSIEDAILRVMALNITYIDEKGKRVWHLVRNR